MIKQFFNLYTNSRLWKSHKKEQLYVILNYWFTATFNDANSVIKLNDKELGTIIGRSGLVDGISEHLGGMSRYKVSITPIIKLDIKDTKIRITYNLPIL